MRDDYEAWLQAQDYDAGTIVAQLHRAGRVEQHYGDLDQHFADDRLVSVIDDLRYSVEDERGDLPNKTPIAITGNLRTNLASYRNAVERYRTFLDGGSIEKRPSSSNSQGPLPAGISSADARTLAEFSFDGQAALSALIAASKYETVAQAVASLTVFTHPDTVAQTGGKALFPTIRGVPGTYVELEGSGLMLDDNKSPTDAFLWSNRFGRRGRDTQFNHVYAASRDPTAYTALANICMTPAFLAKLTDTSPEICALLAYRSFDLYGWTPDGALAPEKPANYDGLTWANPLPKVEDLRERLVHAMARRPKDRTVIAARRLGWLFGGPQPEAISDNTQ